MKGYMCQAPVVCSAECVKRGARRALSVDSAECVKRLAGEGLEYSMKFSAQLSSVRNGIWYAKLGAKYSLLHKEVLLAVEFGKL